MDNGTPVIRKPKRRKPSVKRVVLSLLLTPIIVIFILALIVGIIGGIKGVQNTSKSNSSSRSQAKATPQYHIGDTVSKNGFGLVVNSIKCGEKRISTSGLVNYYSDAQGQFCRLNITVTNTSSGANSIDVADQLIFNTQGQRYTYDSGATANAADAYAGSPLNDDINPGNSITGDIVYDVPVTVTPSAAELEGVRINLQ
jgi:hypothetical protein